MALNEWVEKSLKVANAKGYLDGLTEVYPAIPGSDRPLPEETKDEIRRLHEAKESEKLLGQEASFYREGQSFHPVEGRGSTTT